MPTGKSLKFQKSKFTEEFLDPVSKVTDVASFIVNNEGITAVCNNDANIILFAKYVETKTDEPSKLNIYDIKRFSRLLEIIDSEEVELEVGTNTLSYKASKLKFKYHLAEDAMVPLTKISISKISALNFDCKFFVDKTKVQEILKCSSVVNGSNKLYFTVSKDGGVTAELTDQQTPQSDSVAVSITEEFEGKEVHTPLPINLDVFRLVTGIKFDKVLVKINTELKVLMFELQVGNTALKYIISSLVK
jgi:hypothetical protein